MMPQDVGRFSDIGCPVLRSVHFPQPGLPLGFLLSLKESIGVGFLRNKNSPREFAIRVATLIHVGLLAAPGCSRRWFSL